MLNPWEYISDTPEEIREFLPRGADALAQHASHEGNCSIVDVKNLIGCKKSPLERMHAS